MGVQIVDRNRLGGMVGDRACLSSPQDRLVGRIVVGPEQLELLPSFHRRRITPQGLVDPRECVPDGSGLWIHHQSLLAQRPGFLESLFTVTCAINPGTFEEGVGEFKQHAFVTTEVVSAFNGKRVA